MLNDLCPCFSKGNRLFRLATAQNICCFYQIFDATFKVSNIIKISIYQASIEFLSYSIINSNENFFCVRALDPLRYSFFDQVFHKTLRAVITRTLRSR